MNNGAPLPDITPTPASRSIVVNLNTSTKEIQIVMLERGHQIPGAAIVMNPEQATQHTMALIKAIEMAQDGKHSGLILPGDLVGGKAFRP